MGKLGRGGGWEEGGRWELGRWVEEVMGWEYTWSNWEEEGIRRWVEEVRNGKMCGGVGKR